MITIDPIFSFLNFQETYAVVGVSKNKKKFGRMVFEELKTKGYKVLAINPTVKSFDGEKVYSSIAELPKEVKRVIILTAKSQSADIVQQALDAGMTHVWLQNNCETPKALELGKQGKAQFIYGKCIFMIAEPVKGIHAFHRSIKRAFGSFPKAT